MREDRIITLLAGRHLEICVHAIFLHTTAPVCLIHKSGALLQEGGLDSRVFDKFTGWFPFKGGSVRNE